MSELPDGWAETTLNAVADWGSGGTPKAGTAAYYGGNIPWAVIGDLNDGIVRETAATITELGLRNSSAKFIDTDVVLIAMYGSIGKLGLPAIPMATNQAIAFARPRPAVLMREYLFYYLMHARRKLAAAGKGATQQNISQTILKAWPIPIAPLPEQKRIVVAIEEQFSRLDVGVAALERARRNLKRMRAAVLHAAVTGRLVETERDVEPAESIVYKIKMRRKSDSGTRNSVDVPQDLSPLPGGWCWTTIGELFDVFVGSTPSRNDPRLWLGEVPWVSSGEVSFGHIRMTREHISEAAVGNKDTRLHPPGTVMLAMIGEGKTRGQAAILDIEAAHNQNCASIRVSATPVLPEYVYWVLTERYERTRIMASGGNQLALNSKRVKAIPLPLPPIETQKLIVAEIERRETILAATLSVLDRMASRSAVLRSSILSTAFSGKLSSQDSSDESAPLLLDRIAAERASSKGRKATRKPRVPREKVTA